MAKKNGGEKEYSVNGKLLFEGKYLNNLRNGKSEEYYDDRDNDGRDKLLLEFDGEHLNNKRNGKGKEYHYNGKLKYDGVFLNGSRNGKEKNIIMKVN